MKVLVEFLRLKFVETSRIIKSLGRCLLEFSGVLAFMAAAAVALWIPGYLAIGILAWVNMPLAVVILNSFESDALLCGPILMASALTILGLLGFLAWEMLKWLHSNWEQAKRNVQDRESAGQISG